jgi:hypothetical protein
MHNAESGELEALREILEHDGALEVRDSTEVRVAARERVEMSIATDLVAATRAKVFLGNRWSSVGSNVALMRYVEGRGEGTYFY